MNLQRLVFVDTETTGLDLDRHEVWEIAYAVGNGPVVVFQRPLYHGTLNLADPKALEINGFHERYREPTWEVYRHDMDEFESALKGRHVVGSNPAFDTAFLRDLFVGESAPWHHRLVDLATLAMPLFKSPLPVGMAKVAEILGVVQDNSHTAQDDVRVLRECYKILAEKYELYT